MSDGYAKRRYRRQVFSGNGNVARQRSSLLILILACSAVIITPILFFALEQVF